MNRFGHITVPVQPLQQRRTCRVPRGANFLAVAASNAESMVDLHYFYEVQMDYDEENNMFGPAQEQQLVDAHYYLLPSDSDVPPGDDMAVFGYTKVNQRVIFAILEDVEGE